MLLPRLEAEDLGFDIIEIDTPTQAEGIDAVALPAVKKSLLRSGGSMCAALRSASHG